MMIDPELKEWSHLFRSAQPEPAEIARRARKAVRNFHLWIYAEVAVTVVMGGGATIWALQAHQSATTLLAVWVWISLAAAWLFRLINDWDDFTGVAVATGSYLNTLLRRLRSKLRAAEFGGLLFIIQLLVTSAWVFHQLNSQSPISLRDYVSLPANLVFAAGTVIFYAWLIRYRRKLFRQIADLEKLQTEWEEEPVAPHPKHSPGIAAILGHAVANLERFRKKLRVY